MLTRASTLKRAVEKYAHAPGDALTAANEAITLDPLCLEAISANVVCCSTDQDLAVLKMDTILDTLKPLPMAGSAPKTGDKIFAIGSPGLGDSTLEQSISERFIAASAREIEDKSFLQHTAAINPGNSGGPLLDEHCRIIGIVTLKAKLENVGFAIPADRVRTFYTAQ